MSKKLDQTGRAAQVHLRELQLCQDKTKSYAVRRREATERLRPMLTEIWAALENGETVNSYSTKEMWAKWFNPGAKGTNAMRQIQRIIADPKEKKAAKRHDVALKDGAFLTRIAAAKEKIADIQRQIHAPFKDGEVRDVRNLYDQIDPVLETVYQEFLALLSPSGYEIMKGKNGWLVQGEEPEVTAAPAPKTVKGKEKKTHATGRERDAKLGRTRCQKEISEVTIDDKNPTCRLCQTSIEQDEHLKNGEEFDALIKGVKITEKERRAAWMDFVNAKHDFIRGKNEFEWLPDKEQAVLVLKNPLHFVKPQATVTVTLKKQVEVEQGTKLRIEAGNAAWGDKKVSKKVYQRILAGLEKYYTYWGTLEPPQPPRPENATVKTQHDLTGNGCHMIAWASPEYDAWVATSAAVQMTPEYTAWNKERTLIVDLKSALINRYDPLTEADLDGDEDADGVGA